MNKKLWNKNYILLLQGQLVSTFGDALYTIALAFYVLKLTGSTAFMGTIIGIATIPRVILGPFFGVIVDRHNKKLLIILSDLIRGISVVGISVLAHKNILTVWMLLVVAVVNGICASLFNPTMETIMPLVVPDKLIQAKSTFEMLALITDMIGQTVGGILYKILGAPFIFLINGVSYLFSAGTEKFISIPDAREQESKNGFMCDMKEGLLYLYKEKGLFMLIQLSFFLNFLFGIVRVLIIPWFTYTDGFGEAKYGLLNGACSLGMMAGMAILLVINIEDKNKYKIYSFSIMGFILFVNLAAIINRVWLVIICFMIAFAFQVVFNTLLSTTVVLKTPENMRGKVTATKLTLGMAASPIGNFIGGILGECMEPRWGIFISGAIAAVISVIYLSRSRIKEYMCIF